MMDTQTLKKNFLTRTRVCREPEKRAIAHTREEIFFETRGVHHLQEEPGMTEEPTLTFGRFAGRPLAAIPSAFLGWAVGLLDLDPALRDSMAAELARRSTRSTCPPIRRRGSPGTLTRARVPRH